MHILFFSHYFPPEGNAPASRTYEHCKRWADQKHAVTVITSVPNAPDGVVYEGYRNRLKQSETVDGIEVTRVWTYIAANKGTLRRILNYLSYMFSAVFWGLFSKKPDVIIATSPQFFCGWAGVIAARLRRVPLILEVRDIWPDSILALGAIHSKYVLRLLQWLELKMYDAARHVITVGKGYKQKLLDKGLQEEDISVIPNGFDCKLFYPRRPDEKIKERYDLNSDFICTYVGTIGLACGLEVVLGAAEMLKNRKRNDIKFLLVGSGAVKNQLQQQAYQQNLDNVIFVGRQDKHKIPGFLSIADVCLVHLRETDLFKGVLPSKIFEAAAMAKPIILGVEGFAAELLKRAKAGISIEPQNAGQLAQAVERLAANPNLCRSFGQAGREYVIKHHNRDILARKYLEIIVDFCDHSPNR